MHEYIILNMRGSMSSCALLGQEFFNYIGFKERIKEVIEEQIKNGVTEFYNLFAIRFDFLCAHIVSDLREKYPHIKNILALQYIPTEGFVIPREFDKCVLLSSRKTLDSYAILYTNIKLVEMVDCVVSGVFRNNGESKIACDYAEKLGKPIIYFMKNI